MVSQWISIYEDVESPTEPGKMSVLTDEIKFTDHDAFYDHILDYYKYSFDRQKEMVAKEFVVEETGPDEFTKKIVIDGAIMTAFGLGNKDAPETDFVLEYHRVQCDKVRRTIKTWTYGVCGFWANEIAKHEGKAQFTSTTICLKSPFRIEYFVESTENPVFGFPPNTRFSNDFVKAYANLIFDWLASKYVSPKLRIVKVKQEADRKIPESLSLFGCEEGIETTNSSRLADSDDGLPEGWVKRWDDHYKCYQYIDDDGCFSWDRPHVNAKSSRGSSISTTASSVEAAENTDIDILMANSHQPSDHRHIFDLTNIVSGFEGRMHTELGASAEIGMGAFLKGAGNELASKLLCRWWRTEGCDPQCRLPE